jgi:glycosyltransferase involved in cell wall biosynthesis
MSQLTLGILTFNNGEYLLQLLNSIENQRDKNFKLLIINNNSTDLTQSVIHNFIGYKHDFEIKVLNNPKNYGSFSGTKQLFLNTLTSHLSIIHGDDLLKDDYVEVANHYINLNPDFCAFNFDLEEIEGNKNILTGNIIKSNWTKFKGINRLLVSGLNPGVMPGAILNIVKLGNNYLNEEFEDSKLNGTEDIFLWQQIIRSSNKIMRVPVATYLYRRHSGQISKNFEIYGLSLGYARKVNFITAKSRFEKLLCVAEIKYEFSVVNFNKSYLEGLNYLCKYKKYSIFRFLNIFIRRSANLINLVPRIHQFKWF